MKYAAILCLVVVCVFIFSMGERGAYSITAVRTYVHPSIRPVCPSVPFVQYVTLLVSMRYLLKGLVYWIEILYTGI